MFEGKNSLLISGRAGTSIVSVPGHNSEANNQDIKVHRLLKKKNPIRNVHIVHVCGKD